MAMGLYDWDLAKQAKRDLLYSACLDPLNVPTPKRCSELKALAFSPEAMGLLEGSGSWQEYALVMQGLAQLAYLLGRAAVWPSLPCNTSWIAM